jgi:hypothetical protein
MKTLLTILACLVGFEAPAQLDGSIIRDIKAWKRGSAPPARLLKFPNGKIDAIPECGLRVIGSEVGDYITQIQDADLLAALIFNSRAEADCVREAIRQLIVLKGPGHVARLFAENQKADPAALERTELAIPLQLLQSPYVSVKVARIAREDMDPGRACTVLANMSTELRAGKAWSFVYGKFAEQNPDMSDRAKDPKSTRTLISYLYDAVVSRAGFDILNSRVLQNVPPEHLREVFRAKHGTLVLKSAGGVYLYRIEGVYVGVANKSLHSTPR